MNYFFFFSKRKVFPTVFIEKNTKFDKKQWSTKFNQNLTGSLSGLAGKFFQAFKCLNAILVVEKINILGKKIFAQNLVEKIESI